ncbi:hypothetical protein CsSME_00029939 [Camellia sinensis var. sinensis]
MLKEALVRAIHDIKNRYTTTIIVMVDESGEGISEVATGSYYGWLAASHSQSVCELSSRRYDVILSLEKLLSSFCILIFKYSLFH